MTDTAPRLPDEAAVATYVERWLGRRLPVLALGSGLDHAAYDVGGRLVLRVVHDDDPGGRAEVRREAALLRHVAALSPVPVPAPVHVDEAFGVIVHQRLSGVPLLDADTSPAADLPTLLGELLTRLHATDPITAARLAPTDGTVPAGWLDDARGAASRAAHLLTPAGRAAVDAFLTDTPPLPTDRLVLCHADLGAEHLLVDPATGALTGVIDWSDAAVTDPAVDLARLLRDLGRDGYDEVVGHYDQPWDDAADVRAHFYARCAALEDLAYGDEHDPRYTAAALAALDRLLPAVD